MRRTFYATVIRPVLWRLDPETAHNMTFGVMVALSWIIWKAEQLTHLPLAEHPQAQPDSATQQMQDRQQAQRPAR